MYIHEFHVRNFLIHQNTALKLHPLTVLVGSNGGGKSALFDAFLNFSMLSRGSIRQAFGPYPFSYNSTIYRGASSVSRIRFTVELSRGPEDDERLQYEIDYQQSEGCLPDPSFTIFNEKLTEVPSGNVLFDRSDPDAYPITQSLRLDTDRSLFSAVRLAGNSPDNDLPDLLEYATKQISRVNKFRLDPYALAAPCRIPEVSTEPVPSAMIPRIGYTGDDLASTLYYLSLTEDAALDAIRSRLRELVPEFDDFEFNTVGTDRIAFALKYNDRRETVPSVRLSSGMLIFIGLITLVSTPNRPPILMIEEPENGLTPQAIKLFYKSVRDLAFHSDSGQRSQVLLSSHSPFVICEAWNGDDRDFINQVKVVEGKSVVRRFSQVIEEQRIPLGKVDGERVHLSLKTAEEVMSGRFSG